MDTAWSAQSKLPAHPAVGQGSLIGIPAGPVGSTDGPRIIREPSQSASEAGNGGHMAKDRSVTSSQAALTLGFMGVRRVSGVAE